MQAISASCERELPVSYEQELYLLGDWAVGNRARHLKASADLSEEIATRQILIDPFTVNIALRLRGALDRAVLREVINEIIRRHAVFRTTFHIERGRAFQRIHPAVGVELREIDLTGRPDCVVKAVIAHNAARLMDLTLGPPLRVLLIRRDENDHILCVSIHHIIFDGWSQSVLLEEFMTLYQAFAYGHPSPLSEPKIQYSDYMLQPRKALQEPRLSLLLSYWKAKLEGMGTAPAIQFPDVTAPAAPIYSGAFKSDMCLPSVANKLKALAGYFGTTLFMVFIAVVASWIFRLTGQTDIGLVIPVANRDGIETESIIGWFANQLLIRIDVCGSSRFSELLQRVRLTMLDAFVHRDLPFIKLQEVFHHSQPDHWNPRRTSVFVDMIPIGLLDPVRVDALTITRCSYAPLFYLSHRPAIDIYISEQPDNFELTLGYPPEWFEDDKVAYLIKCLMSLLSAISENPSLRLAELSFEPGNIG